VETDQQRGGLAPVSRSYEIPAVNGRRNGSFGHREHRR
jgi:hypothetical protein